MPSGRHNRHFAIRARRRRARKQALKRLIETEAESEEPIYKNSIDRLEQMESRGENPNGFGNTIKNNLKDIIYLKSKIWRR
jgi:hypothetical protein